MEIMQRYLSAYPTGLGAYLGLQRALMRMHVARGGTAEDFCQRLAPVFHRRYAPIILEPRVAGEVRGGEENGTLRFPGSVREAAAPYACSQEAA